MGMPPTDISATELFDRLLEQPFPSDVVPFPRKDSEGNEIMVRMMALPSSFSRKARRKVLDQLIKEHKSLTVKDLDIGLVQELSGVGSMIAREEIQQACRYVDPAPGSELSGNPQYAFVFKTVEDLDKLSDAEIESLWGMYLLVKDRYSPSDESFASQEEVNAWVNRLVEGITGPLSLGRLLLPQHAQLTLCLARRVSSICQILTSPPETWQASLESLRQNWSLDTDSSTEPAVEGSNSPGELITPERAKAKAMSLLEQHGGNQGLLNSATRLARSLKD